MRNLPWEKYYSEIKSNNTAQLQTVSHVAHLETSLRIIKDKEIKASLVYYKSKLNEHRILVTWLSPNNWSDGFRYGNIRFQFNFKDLLALNPNIYWVEDMTYSPAACRFLLSKNQDLKLNRYYPNTYKGPLLYNPVDDEYYWNTKICLELMVEKSLSLKNCKNVSFVNHHYNMCCINRDSCKEISMNGSKASLIFLSALLSSDVETNPKLFTKGQNKKIKSGVFQDAISKYLKFLQNVPSQENLL